MKKHLLLLLLAAGLLQACSSSKKTTTAGRDGSSYENAIVMKERSETAGVSAEYAWLRKTYPGYTFLKQSLVPKDKKWYDVLTIQTQEGDKKVVYFDISGFYGKL